VTGLPPTKLASQSYFGQGADATNPALGRYYQTSNNLPWIVNLTRTFEYPIERNDISKAYLKFGNWAETAGSQYTDWYQNKAAGYRNEHAIYKKK
jgi:LruC domain-containing protein